MNDNCLINITGIIICELESGKCRNGSAFFIDNNKIITSKHVIENANRIYFKPIGLGIDYKYEFSEIKDTKKTECPVSILELKHELSNMNIDEGDTYKLKVLQLIDKLTNVEIFKFIYDYNYRSNDNWYSFGYPGIAKEKGHSQRGNSISAFPLVKDKVDIDLSLEQPALPNYKGMSGSPFILDDMLIGIIEEQLVNDGVALKIGAISTIQFKEFINEKYIVKSKAELEFKDMINKYRKRVNNFINKLELEPESNTSIEVLSYESNILNKLNEDTWKSNLISYVNENINYFRISNSFLCKYEEIRNIVQSIEPNYIIHTKIKSIIEKVLLQIHRDGDNKKLRDVFLKIRRLSDKSYNKIILILGESGSGKTHLINNMIKINDISKSSKEYCFFIPLVSNKYSLEIEDCILQSINDYFNTEFKDMNNLDSLINQLNEHKIKIIMLIDDIHFLCKRDPSFYDNLKNTVTNYSVYDWIIWIIGINTFELHQIMDSTDFLERYCFTFDDNNYIKPWEKEPLGYQLKLDELNLKNRIGEKILKGYGIDCSKTSIENIEKHIELLINNPLIAHTYGQTVDFNEADFLNIFYFKFIKKFASTKLNRMISNSKRKLNITEHRILIKEDLDEFLNRIIQEKQVIFRNHLRKSILKELEELMSELHSVYLLRTLYKESYNYYLEDEKHIEPELVLSCDLYWAYKIVMFCVENNISNKLQLFHSFRDLYDELIAFYILYLDFEDKNIELEEVINLIMNENQDRQSFFFTAIKSSFKNQKYIFRKIYNMEYNGKLTKAELFTLIYFLTFSNQKVYKKCKIISRYFGQISNSGFTMYLDSSMRTILKEMKDIGNFRSCLIHFIKCEDLDISKRLASISAVKFFDITYSKHKDDLGKVICDLICFMDDNTNAIIDRNTILTSRSKNNASTFIEFFLRNFFEIMINEYKSNELLFHKIFMDKNYYFRCKSKQIDYLLRSSVAIEYGNYYCNSFNLDFKKNYHKEVKKLIELDEVKYRMLAFHFITNTLRDDRDPNALVNKEFRPLLKEMYEDVRLSDFVKEREAFFKRNIAEFL